MTIVVEFENQKKIHQTETHHHQKLQEVIFGINLIFEIVKMRKKVKQHVIKGCTHEMMLVILEFDF